MTKASDRYNTKNMVYFLLICQQMCIFPLLLTGFFIDSIQVHWNGKNEKYKKETLILLTPPVYIHCGKVWNVNRRQIYLCIKCNFQLKRKTHGKFRILKVCKKKIVKLMENLHFLARMSTNFRDFIGFWDFPKLVGTPGITLVNWF